LARWYDVTRGCGAGLGVVMCSVLRRLGAAVAKGGPFRGGALVLVLLTAAVVAPRIAFASTLSRTNGHGILPPSNPSRSLSPNPDFVNSSACQGSKDTASCNSLVEKALKYARQSLEGMGPLRFDFAAYLRLDKVEQLFVITNLERVSRRLAPVSELSHRLDVIAQKGAVAGIDPSLVGLVGVHLSGGGLAVSAGANWASGYDTPLGSDYGWMYDDGPGGADAECNHSHTGCWGHRDNILGTYASKKACGSSEYETVMGAGYLAHGGADGDSETELFVGICGKAPTDTVFTWTKAKKLLGLG
jgi:hypothetical protein